MNDSRSLTRQHGFGFAGGLILLGVFGLLWNLDVLPDGFWGEFWTLWPLLVGGRGREPGAVPAARLDRLAWPRWRS